VRQDLVLDHGRVVVYVYGLDGHRRDLGDEDAAEGVCDGGVDADEREGRLIAREVVKLYLEALAELFEGPAVVLAGEVSGKVCRGDVGDCLLVDADRLEAECQSGQAGEGHERR
jgi:hypothetical protein